MKLHGFPEDLYFKKIFKNHPFTWDKNSLKCFIFISGVYLVEIFIFLLFMKFLLVSTYTCGLPRTHGVSGVYMIRPGVHLYIQCIYVCVYDLPKSCFYCYKKFLKFFWYIHFMLFKKKYFSSIKYEGFFYNFNFYDVCLSVMSAILPGHLPCLFSGDQRPHLPKDRVSGWV